MIKSGDKNQRIELLRTHFPLQYGQGQVQVELRVGHSIFPLC